jgi:hypothetical protein
VYVISIPFVRRLLLDDATLRRLTSFSDNVQLVFPLIVFVTAKTIILPLFLSFCESSKSVKGSPPIVCLTSILTRMKEGVGENVGIGDGFGVGKPGAKDGDNVGENVGENVGSGVGE